LCGALVVTVASSDLRHAVFNQDTPDLPYLVPLRFSCHGLEVDQFRNGWMLVDMVAAANAPLEAETLESGTKIRESDTRVGVASQDGACNLRDTPRPRLPARLPWADLIVGRSRGNDVASGCLSEI